MNNILQAKGIEKFYGKRAVLKNFSLTVPTGSIFALLGPNGSGKTTFVKSVLGLVKISSGSITLNGHPHTLEKSRVGVAFLPDSFNFYPYYRVEQVVHFYGKAYGIEKSLLSQKADNVLQIMKMKKNKGLKIKELSKGMLQRTGLASLLMGDNNFYILDEPFTGIDPIGIKELKDIILQLSKEGKTIFINSHILSEVEQICSHGAIIKEGQVVASGELATMVGNSSLEDYFYQMAGGGDD